MPLLVEQDSECASGDVLDLRPTFEPTSEVPVNQLSAEFSESGYYAVTCHNGELGGLNVSVPAAGLTVEPLRIDQGWEPPDAGMADLAWHVVPQGCSVLGRSLNRWILPVAVFGRSSTIS